MVLVKKLNANNINDIYQLGKEQFGGEFWYTKDFIKATLKRKGIYYGAFDGKKLIGAIMVDVGLDRPKSWVFFFDVKKEYRNHGVGNQLMEQAQKDIPDGYYKLFVDLEASDKQGVAFYTHHGFKKCARVKDWFGTGTFGLLYSKTLEVNRDKRTTRSFFGI